MHATYNPWLVTLSIIVAILVSYTALRLTERVAGAERRAGRLWVLGGAVSMGIGIWSMHFIGMLAFSVPPVTLRYNLLINLASLFIGMLTSLFALSISSRSDLSLRRLAVSSILMGAGICGMHYTGMAAIQIVPAITYSPLLVAASIAIAITASFVALWLFFQLRSGESRLLKLARAGAAVVMGLAIAGMHYTAMAASMLAPGSYCYGGGAALDNDWLAVMIGMIALGVVAITLITTLYDAHLESRTRRDATRLAELNASLQHGKSLLTLATEAAGIACWEYDLAQRRIIWTENEIPAIKGAGLDPREHPGALLASFYPEDVVALKAAIRAALGRDRESCEMRMRVSAPGGTIHLQAHARLFRDERGRLRRLLGVSWDVTEQVRQEERRTQLQLQLQEASRHAGMAEVATGVLHSVGNVLNSLGVSAAMLQSRLRESRVANVERAAKLIGEQGPRLAEFLTSDPRGKELPGYLRQLGDHLVAENRTLCEEAQAVVVHVEHIGKIVAAQQTYARHGGAVEEIDVAELIDHALIMHFSTSAEVALRRENGAVGKVMVDRHKLLQIMGNLLSNARHALRDTKHGPRELMVRLRALPAGFYAIDVEDTGIGISAEAMKRLFEFGFTTKKDGHGFGLHASAILAKEMGGDLTARSEGVNRGACFTVRLPVAAAEAEPQRRSA